MIEIRGKAKDKPYIWHTEFRVKKKSSHLKKLERLVRKYEDLSGTVGD